MPEIKENEIVRPIYKGVPIWYATPIDAIIDNQGRSLPDYINEQVKLAIGHYAGTIIESGSNSNGQWVKFTDGTMVCFNNITITSGRTNSWGNGLYYASRYDWTFPKQFYNDNVSVQCLSLGNLNDGAWTVCNGVINKTKITELYVMGIKSTNTSSKITPFAIGRWKAYDSSVTPDDTTKAILNSPLTNITEDERIVGTYMNKPMYMKRVKYTVASGNTNTSITHNLDIDVLAYYSGVCTVAGQTYASHGFRPFPYMEATSSNKFVITSVTNKVITFVSSWASNTVWLTLYYTKASDAEITQQESSDIVTVVNGRDITNLDTIIQSKVLENVSKMLDSLTPKQVAKLNAPSSKTVGSGLTQFAFGGATYLNSDYITLDSSNYAVVMKSGRYRVYYNIRYNDVSSALNTLCGVSINKSTADLPTVGTWLTNTYRLTFNSTYTLDLVKGDTLGILGCYGTILDGTVIIEYLGPSIPE